MKCNTRKISVFIVQHNLSAFLCCLLKSLLAYELICQQAAEKPLKTLNSAVGDE